jgi:hypothetical protein
MTLVAAAPDHGGADDLSFDGDQLVLVKSSAVPIGVSAANKTNRHAGKLLLVGFVFCTCTASVPSSRGLACTMVPLVRPNQ